jgi:hypothetical protein
MLIIKTGLHFGSAVSASSLAGEEHGRTMPLDGAIGGVLVDR